MVLGFTSQVVPDTFQGPFKYDLVHCGPPSFGKISGPGVQQWVTYHRYVAAFDHFYFYDAGKRADGTALPPATQRPAAGTKMGGDFIFHRCNLGIVHETLLLPLPLFCPPPGILSHCAGSVDSDMMAVLSPLIGEGLVTVTPFQELLQFDLFAQAQVLPSLNAHPCARLTLSSPLLESLRASLPCGLAILRLRSVR